MKYSLKITAKQLDWIKRNEREYKSLGENRFSEPKIIVNVPNGNHYTTPELLASSELMLKNSLDTVQTHIDIGDDAIPQIRVEFGTGQVAHAFGCGMYVPKDSPVCARGHILPDAAFIDSLEMPSLDAGWFGKCYEYTSYFMEEKPPFVGLMLPDFQSPFNNAHLIRGNDILFDFYDEPERLGRLLSVCAGYQAKLIRHYRALTGMEEGTQYDWGIIWKGNARLSNCSLHMISTPFYRDFIKAHDQSLLNEIGGGRIHYCGEHDNGLMNEFFSMEQMYGVDFDGKYHDIFALAEDAPDSCALLTYCTGELIARILETSYPGKKNNLIFQVFAASVEEGRALYTKLKAALQKGRKI